MIIRWNDTTARMEWAEEERVFPQYPFGPQPDRDKKEEIVSAVEEEEPTVGDLTDIELIAGDPVLQWRAKRLTDNGMIPAQARALALDRTVDVTWVVDRLLKRGCDTTVAFDIASGLMVA